MYYYAIRKDLDNPIVLFKSEKQAVFIRDTFYPDYRVDDFHLPIIPGDNDINCGRCKTNI